MVTADHLDLTSDRYYVILLPIVVALVFTTLDALVLSHFGGLSGTMRYVLASAMLLWSVYPIYALQSYLRQAVVQGEPTNYNIANSANFRELSVVKATEGLLREDRQATIYSNYVNIVWFIFRQPVEALPFEDQTLPTLSGSQLWSATTLRGRTALGTSSGSNPTSITTLSPRTNWRRLPIWSCSSKMKPGRSFA